MVSRRSKSKAREGDGAHWNDLSPELVGRIIGNLNCRERCRTIPHLSKACRQAHQDYPPTHKEYDVDGPVSHSLASWFLHAIAPSVESLTVYRFDTTAMDYLPQMLAMTGLVAPRLHTLSLVFSDSDAYDRKAEILSVAFLTSVRRLCIEAWRFPPGDCDASINQLSALTSLQSLQLDYFAYSEASAKQSKALWSTLASLKKLEEVRIDTGIDNVAEGFLSEVSRVTQLRNLFCGDDISKRHLDIRNSFARGLSALTQLTKLALEVSLPALSLHPVADLCLLEDLELDIGSVGDHAGLSLKSPCLTRLRVRASVVGGIPGLTSLEQILSAAAPALAHLKSLELDSLNIQTISSTLTAALCCLTNLRMNGSDIRGLPAAFSALKALVSLDISRNAHLQLWWSDIDILFALPHLKHFLFAKGSGSWSQESLEVVVGLMKSLPNLKTDLVGHIMGDRLRQ